MALTQMQKITQYDFSFPKKFEEICIEDDLLYIMNSLYLIFQSKHIFKKIRSIDFISFIFHSIIRNLKLILLNIHKIYYPNEHHYFILFLLHISSNFFGFFFYNILLILRIEPHYITPHAKIGPL